MQQRLSLTFLLGKAEDLEGTRAAAVCRAVDHQLDGARLIVQKGQCLGENHIFKHTGCPPKQQLGPTQRQGQVTGPRHHHFAIHMMVG